jgi:hypothetical protein
MIAHQTAHVDASGSINPNDFEDRALRRRAYVDHSTYQRLATEAFPATPGRGSYVTRSRGGVQSSGP